MNSTSKQIEFDDKIIKAEICPYCNRKPQLVDSKVIYGRSYGLVYYCKPCEAYVGVHKGSTIPLGRLANKELRGLKKNAHKYFDKLWQEGHIERNEAYQALADYLKIPKEYTHIGMFNKKLCVETILWSKNVIKDLNQIDKDFGK